MADNPGALRQSRMILLLIAGTPITMILAASWLWYFVVNGDLDLVSAIGTANNGELITPPRQITEIPLQDDAGAAFRWQDLDARWTMLVVNRGEQCDQACERRLYFTRQIHIALGKEFNRVRRVYLGNTAVTETSMVVPASLPEGWPEGLRDADLPEYLALGHKGLVALKADDSVLTTLFPEYVAEGAQWYLVDPAGWVMMRIPDELNYKSVISDLKFLLKHSGG